MPAEYQSIPEDLKWFPNLHLNDGKWGKGRTRETLNQGDAFSINRPLLPTPTPPPYSLSFGPRCLMGNLWQIVNYLWIASVRETSCNVLFSFYASLRTITLLIFYISIPSLCFVFFTYHNYVLIMINVLQIIVYFNFILGID